MECHALRRAARRGSFPSPLQYLPGPAGHVRRDSSHTGIHPRRAPGLQSGIPQGDRSDRRARKRGDRAAVRELRKQQRSLPSRDPQDPGYRRLRYCRYADDHLLGFTGPKAEAEQIKARLAQFLRDDLKLELSEDKTLITHARTQAARFLGYEITVQHSRDRPTGQRQHPAARAQGGDQGQMRPLPQARKTRAPRRAAESP